MTRAKSENQHDIKADFIVASCNLHVTVRVLDTCIYIFAKKIQLQVDKKFVMTSILLISSLRYSLLHIVEQ